MESDWVGLRIGFGGHHLNLGASQFKFLIGFLKVGVVKRVKMHLAFHFFIVYIKKI